MQDGRDKIVPEDTREAGDPAEAFDALRRTVDGLAGDLTREMTTIRKGVEAAFDEVDKIRQPTDYGPDLARIVKQLGTVGERLDAVEKAPVLRYGPDHYARALESAGGRVADSAVRAIDAPARDLGRVSADLGGYLRSARLREEQNWWVWGAAWIGLNLGVLLTLLLPRILPFQAAPRVASLVMGDTPWQAGIRLMAFGDPTSWQRVVAADHLVVVNRDAVSACRQAAAKAGKDQHCTITVAASGR